MVLAHRQRGIERQRALDLGKPEVLPCKRTRNSLPF